LSRPEHLDAKPLGEQGGILREVAQQDVLAEPGERPAGVAGEPVVDDLGLGFQDVLRFEAVVEAMPCSGQCLALGVDLAKANPGS